MILVDTSFLMALAVPQDALHLRAAAWSEVVRDRLVTTEYVLVEFMNALSSPRNRGRAHALFNAFQNHPAIEIVTSSTDLFRIGVALHRQRPDQSWSLTDCISFAVMQQRRINQALTHDHHFEQAGFAALLREDP
jgi:uncharacterized protein